jgi:hypothetical protein
LLVPPNYELFVPNKAQKELKWPSATTVGGLAPLPAVSLKVPAPCRSENNKHSLNTRVYNSEESTVAFDETYGTVRLILFDAPLSTPFASTLFTS